MNVNYDISQRKYRRQTMTVITETQYNSSTHTYEYDYVDFTDLNKSGQKYDDYKAMIKRGDPIKPLPLRYVRENYVAWNGTHISTLYGYQQPSVPRGMRHRSTVIGMNGDNLAIELPELSSFKVSQTQATAIQKLLAKVKDMKVNMVQAVAEMHQNAAMFEKTAYRFADFIALLQQKKLRKACKIIGTSPSRGLRKRYGREWDSSPSAAVANAFLELSFGWGPLIEDLKGFAERMAQIMDATPPPPSISRARGGTQDNETRTWPESNGRTMSEVRKASYIYSTGVTFELDDVTNDAARKIGLTNPLEVGWQLLPWSFFVDWAVGIGDILTTLDATTGLKFKSGWVKEVFEFSNDATCTWNQYQYEGWNHTGAVSSSRSKIIVTRDALKEFPSSYVPVLSNPFSTKHIGLALALLRQRFG